jgi:hypothetical protein
LCEQTLCADRDSQPVQREWADRLAALPLHLSNGE